MDSIGTEEKGYLGSGWAFPVTFSIGNLELNLTQYEENVNNSIDIILKQTGENDVWNQIFVQDYVSSYLRKWMRH